MCFCCGDAAALRNVGVESRRRVEASRDRVRHDDAGKLCDSGLLERPAMREIMVAASRRSWKVSCDEETFQQK